MKRMNAKNDAYKPSKTMTKKAAPGSARNIDYDKFFAGPVKTQMKKTSKPGEK